ncbi:hypothetical protein [Pyxidicoccus sp. MSG2]|uniref:hypothetical protein n=1 Tax=Pyxidicoccus sp. MSG2 TaxID=2996790 RepID=UPI00226FCA4A|nr:hypothetical protein [Pyxidicoccus sp. MSG2]MCY1018615.1 hypothetical protein [Pyxidicoccus sp. MSG2]
MDELLSRSAEMLRERIARSNLALRASELTRRHTQQEGHNGGLYGGPIVHTESFEERGFVLVDRYTQTRGENLNFEFFGGSCLVLLTDGRLAELERSGSSGCDTGEWNATMRFVSAEEAVSRYGFEACVARL